MSNISETLPNQRVIAYIDGFNLYHGIMEDEWRQYLWLNVHNLAASLLLSNQTLIKTKYFTARISGPPESVKRQSTYIDALTALGVEVIEGRYQMKERECSHCTMIDEIPEEKETDVNIAVAMTTDALSNLCEMALLVSGDADLKAPVIAVKNSGRKAIVAFPPNRHSDVLRRNASGVVNVNQNLLKNNQLPEQVFGMNNFILTRPPRWN